MMKDNPGDEHDSVVIGCSEISESEALELDALIEHSLSLDPIVIAQRLSDDDRVRLERIEKRLFEGSTIALAPPAMVANPVVVVDSTRSELKPRHEVLLRSVSPLGRSSRRSSNSMRVGPADPIFATSNSSRGIAEAAAPGFSGSTALSSPVPEPDLDFDHELENHVDEEPVIATGGSDDDYVNSDPRPIVRGARAKTIQMKRLTKEELRIGALLYPERNYWRPKTRGECANVSRPCPYISCKHHLYIDANPSTGSIKINFPDLEPWELQHSCALDVAQTGGVTLEEVAEMLNMTRERVRQIEARGLLKLKEEGGEEVVTYLTRE